MRKPTKAGKTMVKTKEVAPADQQLLETVCEFCRKLFRDPTTARIHMDEEHLDEYA